MDLTREDAQSAWEKIVDTGFSDYESLTRDQRVWFNVEPLTTDGLIDHYINHGAEHNSDTISDLEYLGFSEVSGLLKSINKLFKNGTPPTDIDERNDEIGDWDGKHDLFLDKVDKDFWTKCPDIEIALLRHINATGIGKS